MRKGRRRGIGSIGGICVRRRGSAECVGGDMLVLGFVIKVSGGGVGSWVVSSER